MSVLTRIKNNQILDSTIYANAKIVPGSIVGSLFNSNITMTSDVTITGNLIVQGASTYLTVASTNTYVNDPLIVMNNAFSGTNTYDLGFIFNRGSLLNQAIVWNEYNKEFRFIGTTESGTTYGNVDQSNFANVRLGNLDVVYSAGFGSIESEGSIQGASLNVTGNVLAATIGASFLTASTVAVGNIAAVNFGNASAIFTGASINLSANVLAASGVFNAMTVNGDETVTGYLNVTGNILTASLSTGQINTTGNVLATAGTFNALTVNGSGSLTGNLNVTGNVVGNDATFASATVNGLINTTSNVLATGLTVFGNTTLGLLGQVSGSWINVVGNISQTSSGGAVYINTSGNILAAQGSFGAINSTGYINTAGNISTAQLNAGEINTTGNVLATAGTFNALTVNGDETVTGYLNVTGNILADTSTFSALTVNGNIATTGQFATTRAGNPGDAGGQIFLNGSTSNRIDWNINGTGGPSLTTRSAGTKLVLYPALSGSSVDYAIGIDSATLWSSVAENDNSFNFKWFGGDIVVANLSGTGNFTTAGAIVVNGTAPSSSSATGALIVKGGAGIAGNLYVGAGIQNTPIGNTTASSGAFTTLSASGVVEFTNATEATGLGTGAVRITGGTSVGGNLFVGGNINFVGSSYILTGNTGVFYGDANGFGALYAGTAGYTPLPQTVLQTQADFNGYVQNNFENINTGAQASTDWVATAGDGSDYDHYINMGITTVNWDGTQDNSLTDAVGANDGYLYVQGNISTGQGGNLTVGASTPGAKEVKIVAGGNTAASISAVFRNPNTPATTTTTGAFTVTGGVGITGNAVIGGNLLAQGAATLQSTLTTAGAVGFTNSTNSSSATQGGALTIAGGAAVAKDLWVGGNIYAANIVGTSYQYLTIVDPLVNFSANSTYPYSYDIGFYSAFIGGPANLEATSGVVRDDTDGVWKFFSNAGDPTGSAITFDANVIYDGVKAGNLFLTDVTNSSSNSTGALRVTGGAGIGGSLYARDIQGTVIGNVAPAAGTFTSVNSTGNIIATDYTGGSLNVTGNVSAATLNVGQINTTGNVIAATVGASFLTASTVAVGNISAVTIGNAGATVTGSSGEFGAVQSGFIGNTGTAFTGASLNVTGNVLSSTVDASFLTASTIAVGNISAVTIGNAGATITGSSGEFGAVQSGFIGNTGTAFTGASLNVTGNVSAATLISGQINTSGNVLANTVSSYNVYATNAEFINFSAAVIGNITSTLIGGTLNVVGNIIGGQAQFASINATPIGNATPDTGAFTTLSADSITVPAINNIVIGNVTPAAGTFTTLVAGQVSSGFIGNTGTAFTGASLNVTGNVLASGGVYSNLVINGNTTSGITRITGVDTKTTSATTGALIVNGGLGLTGNLVVNTNEGFAGRITFGDNDTIYGAYTTLSPQGIFHQQGAGPRNIQIRFTNGRGIGLQGNAADDNSYVYASNSIQFTTGTTLAANGTITGGVSLVSINRTGELFANANTVSTSTTTGALVVAGGVGIGDNLTVNASAVFNDGQTNDNFVIKAATSTAGLIYDTGNQGLIINGPGYESNVAPIKGATLAIRSQDAMLIPVGSTAKRPGNDGNVDVTGMMRFNTTSNNLEWYNGSDWAVPGASTTVITDQQILGNGVATTFTINNSSTTNSTIVSINGVVQAPVSAYGITGTTLTFTEAPADGDLIDVRTLTTTSVIAGLTSANGFMGIDLADTANNYANVTAGASAATVRISITTDGIISLVNDAKIANQNPSINIASASTPYVLDTFVQTKFSTAKYVVQAKRDSTNIESMDAIVVTDGTGNAFVSVYGVINNGTAMGTLSANVLAGNVQLYYTSTSLTNSNVRVTTSYIK